MAPSSNDIYSRNPQEYHTPDGEREAFLGHSEGTESASRKTISSSSSRDPSPAAPKSSPVAHLPSTTLHRSFYVLFLVLLYAALALTSWVLLCLLTFNPLSAHRYGANIDNSNNNGYGWVSALYISHLYVKSERYFRAARVMQAIVSTLTIPLTSAVCSRAAVVFVQQRKQQLGFSMRQLMTLADKGWTDPEVLLRLIFAGWKKHGSSFLLLAILLNALGAVIAPIQQLFLTQKTIQTPTFPGMLMYLTDMPDFFNTDGSTHDSNLVTVLTRNVLTSTTNSDIQPRLWTDSWSCDALNHTDNALPVWCDTDGGITLGNVSTLPNPWLAQLPSSYNSGLIKQFLPRFNFSVARENVTEEGMPTDCANLPGAFYAQYAKLNDDYPLSTGNWSIEICMPANQSSTPWKSTRLRQDFMEELYLNISVVGYEFGSPSDPQSEGGIFKFTSNTTAGYFELPNYMNGGTAGSLIDGDPSDYCGQDCYPQGSLSDPIYDHNITSRSANITGAVTNETNTALSLDAVMNKGPLLTVVMALFGDNSFIPARVKNTAAYIYDDIPRDAAWAGVCVDQAPLMALLRDELNQDDVYNNIGYCITNDVLSPEDVDSQIASYIRAFYYSSWDGFGGERIVNAFTSAVYLATEQWLLNPPGLQPSLTVSYDLGADTQVPVISRRGIIVVSVLLGLDIACLLAVALYSAITPRWTEQLDSFAMMRIGAAMSKHLPLHIAHRTTRIEVLDTTPGFVGDAAAMSEDPDTDDRKKYIGELGLGAAKPLRRAVRYRCYPADHAPHSSVVITTGTRQGVSPSKVASRDQTPIIR